MTRRSIDDREQSIGWCPGLEQQANRSTKGVDSLGSRVSDDQDEVGVAEGRASHGVAFLDVCRTRVRFAFNVGIRVDDHDGIRMDERIHERGDGARVASSFSMVAR